MEDFSQSFSAELSKELNLKRFENEQEGFSHALSVPANEVPRCSSAHGGHGTGLVDHRGVLPDETGRIPGDTFPFQWMKHAEWLTGAALSTETTVFTWLGGSEARPFHSAFPYCTATLIVQGKHRLQFPIGWAKPYSISAGDFTLSFEPTRFQSLVEDYDRRFKSQVAGFYRLTVPGKHLAKGSPVNLRVELDKNPEGMESFFFVSPRTDALRVNFSSLRDEVVQLRSDLMSLRMSHEMLYAQNHPELFPAKIKGEKIVVALSPNRHLLVPHLTVLSNDEVVVAAREGTSHVSLDGKMVLYRSKDGGRTWGPQEPMFDLGNVDHRSTSITELPNGDWVGLDYRLGAAYKNEVLDGSAVDVPSCWSVWSTDKGKSWHFSEKPICVPDAFQFVEPERHAIRLPSGRLIAAAIFMDRLKAGAVLNIARDTRIGIFCSDDNGRHWRHFSSIPHHPWVYGESPVLRTKSGRILCMGHGIVMKGDDWPKTGAVMMQSVSTDEGETWSPMEPTGMSSMGSPGDLTQLQDGRIMCTHASRHYPNSVYVTVSHDEGRTWDTRNTRILMDGMPTWDFGYPSTGQLADGTLVTVWYGNLFGKFFVSGLRYRPEDL